VEKKKKLLGIVSLGERYGGDEKQKWWAFKDTRAKVSFARGVNSCEVGGTDIHWG